MWLSLNTKIKYQRKNMSETTGNKPSFNTVGVYVGTSASPLLVTRASTDFEGMKKGDSKGKLFLEVQIKQSQLDAFLNIPEIKDIVETTIEEIEKNNAPIKAKLAQLEASKVLTEPVRKQLEKDLRSWKDFGEVMLDKDYNPILLDGEQTYRLSFGQKSVHAQMTDAKNPKTLSECIFVRHYIKNANGAWSQLVDADKNPVAKQTFGGGKVFVQINTFIAKAPATGQESLSTSRMVKIFHVEEGTASGSGGVAVNNPFGDDEIIEDEIVVENANVVKTTNDTQQKQTPPPADSDPYANKPQVETQASTQGYVAPQAEANPYAQPSPVADVPSEGTNPYANTEPANETASAPESNPYAGTTAVDTSAMTPEAAAAVLGTVPAVIMAFRKANLNDDGSAK
jgi:hypothetical protein